MSTWMLTNALEMNRPRAIGRRAVRLTAVTAAMAFALAIWVIAEFSFGIDLRTPAFDGSPQTLPIRFQDVLLVSALLSFAAWGLIAVLEFHGRGGPGMSEQRVRRGRLWSRGDAPRCARAGVSPPGRTPAAIRRISTTILSRRRLAQHFERSSPPE